MVRVYFLRSTGRDTFFPVNLQLEPRVSLSEPTVVWTGDHLQRLVDGGRR